MSDKYDETYTLYKLNTSGSIQVWNIMRKGDRYKTSSGIQGGAITETKWTVAKAKNVGRSNATSAEQQAQLDMLAKMKRKVEVGFVKDIADVAQTGLFKPPTLAHKWADHKDKVGYPCLVSAKLDGIRCLASEENGMRSRNDKPFVSSPHVLKALKPFFEAHPGIVFDGELYNHQLKEDFDKICSLIKKQKPTPAQLIESAEMVQYHVFDYQGSGSYAERYKNLCEMFVDHPIIKVVKHAWVADEEDLLTQASSFIQDGYEGLMVRNPLAQYEYKRTTNLLKYKCFTDGEFTILDIEEGDGNRSGMMGRLKLITDDGTKFDSSAKGDHSYFRHLLECKNDYIGKKATVRYQNLTPGGVPRFPVVVAIRDFE